MGGSSNVSVEGTMSSGSFLALRPLRGVSSFGEAGGRATAVLAAVRTCTERAFSRERASGCERKSVDESDMKPNAARVKLFNFFAANCHVRASV